MPCTRARDIVPSHDAWPKSWPNPQRLAQQGPPAGGTSQIDGAAVGLELRVRAASALAYVFGQAQRWKPNIGEQLARRLDELLHLLLRSWLCGLQTFWLAAELKGCPDGAMLRRCAFVVLSKVAQACQCESASATQDYGSWSGACSRVSSDAATRQRRRFQAKQGSNQMTIAPRPIRPASSERRRGRRIVGILFLSVHVIT